MKRTLRTALLVAAALTVGGAILPATMVSASPKAPRSVGGGPIAQSVLGSGSDTTYNMMTAMDVLYDGSAGCDPIGTIKPKDFSCISPDPAGTITTENYEHDQVHEAFPIGSGGGIGQLCSKGQTNIASIDFARSSRVPSSSDCSGTHFVAYALDGITVEAFPGVSGGPTDPANFNNTSGACAGHAGVFCLTKAQAIGIWVTCTITNWNQVGSSLNEPISLYTAQSNSGTRQSWDTYLGGSSSTCIGGDSSLRANAPENENQYIINGDATGGTDDRRDALFYFSNGVYRTTVNKNAAPGAVASDESSMGLLDGVFPTNTTISNGTFGASRQLFNVYCTASCAVGASSTAAVNYVGEKGWICKVSSQHSTDPLTGKNYHQEITSVINSNHFVALPVGPIGGGVTGQDFCRLTTH